MTGIPRLETERLVLRGPESRDCGAFMDFYTSERAKLTDHSDSRTDAWKAFAAGLGHWRLRGFGLWVVTMRGSDESLGMVGCWQPEGWPEPEIGWLLWAGAEGRGIAYEAALASRGYAYRELGWPTAVSYIAPENVRSIRLAERLGAVRDDGAERPEGDDCLVYRHPSPEALQ